MRPCSLNESRVITWSWRCKGEGRERDVPGMGSEGAVGCVGGWRGRLDVLVDIRESDDVWKVL